MPAFFGDEGSGGGFGEGELHASRHADGGTDEVVISEGNLSFTDVTTNNASTTKHGLLKKLSNTSTEFMNGQGDWATPAASITDHDHTGDSGDGGLLGTYIRYTLFDAKGDIIAASAADTGARLAVGSNNQVLMAASGETTGLKWAHPVVTNSMNQLAADVTMTSADTFYDGPSLSLVAATWLIMYSVHVLNGQVTGQDHTTKLWDGSTVWASTCISHNGSGDAQHSGTAIITLGSTTTVKVSVASKGAASTILKAAANNGAGDNASTLVAVRIA